jgi:hypothetical protein
VQRTTSVPRCFSTTRPQAHLRMRQTCLRHSLTNGCRTRHNCTPVCGILWEARHHCTPGPRTTTARVPPPGGNCASAACGSDLTRVGEYGAAENAAGGALDSYQRYCAVRRQDVAGSAAQKLSISPENLAFYQGTYKANATPTSRPQGSTHTATPGTPQVPDPQDEENEATA